MKKKLKILFFCMVFAASGAFAQQAMMVSSNQILVPTSFLSFQSVFRLSLSDQNNRAKNNWLVPGNFYARHLPFICRKEIQFDKVTPLQFRFRLGSVEQCNWLEGKTSTR